MSGALSPRSRRTSLGVADVDTGKATNTTNPPSKRSVSVVLDPTPAVKEQPQRKRQRRSNSVATPPVAEENLNEYELQRAARIAANLERLQALNIDKLSGDMFQAKPEKRERVRGLSTSRRGRASAPALEPRKSLRVQGLAPDGTLAAGIADERRDGTVILASGGTFSVVETPRNIRPVGHLPFKSLNAKEDTDAAFLATLRAFGECGGAAADVVPAAELKKLSLAERNVAKVCIKGVTHMDFMPVDDGTLIVAAGDKEGHVGLFHPDAASATVVDSHEANEQQDTEDDDGAADGVHLTRPFGQYVSGLRWARHGTHKLFACSYDGSVRCLDVNAGQWLESFLSSEEEFSSFDITASGDTAYVGDNDGGLTIVDMRTGTAAAGPAFSAHYERVNCTSLAPDGQALLATSSSDRTVAVWDLRKGLSRGVKPLHQLQHGKSCHGAYWAPQGPARVLTTSYDDTINVFGADGNRMLRIKHNNQTGKWLLPFRAIWTSSGDGVVVGSMHRETEIFSADNGAPVARHSSEYLTAIPTRHACHASGTAIAAGTASGRVHIWRHA